MPSHRRATRWPYDTLFLWFAIPVVVLVFLLIFVPRASVEINEYVSVGSAILEALETVPQSGDVAIDIRLAIADSLEATSAGFSADALNATTSLVLTLRDEGVAIPAKMLSNRLHEIYGYAQIQGDAFAWIAFFRWAPTLIAFVSLVLSLLGLRYLIHVYVEPLAIVLTSLREGAFQSTYDALPSYAHPTVRRLGTSITRVETKIQEVLKPFSAQDEERLVLHQLLALVDTPAWIVTNQNRILAMNEAALEVMGSLEGDYRRDQIRELVEIAASVREDTGHEWDFDPNAEGWDVEELIVGEIWLFLRESHGGRNGAQT